MGKGRAIGRALRGIIGRLVPSFRVRQSQRLPGRTAGPPSGPPAGPTRLSEVDARGRAVTAARQAASAGAGPKANKTAAAVDRRTGQAFTGVNRERPPLHPELRRRVPPQSETRWRVDNCAEISAVNRALSAGSRFDDLVVETVHSRSLERVKPCLNCEKWVP